MCGGGGTWNSVYSLEDTLSLLALYFYLKLITWGQVGSNIFLVVHVLMGFRHLGKREVNFQIT